MHHIELLQDISGEICIFEPKVILILPVRMFDPIYPNTTHIELIADYTLALPFITKINYSVNKFASM